MKIRGQCHGWISQSRMCPGRRRLIKSDGERGRSVKGSKLKATKSNKGREGPVKLGEVTVKLRAQKYGKC